MQVDLAGDLRRRMPKKRLQCSKRCIHRIEKSCVGVAQRMPTDSLKSECLACRRKLTIRQIATAQRRGPFCPEYKGFGIQSVDFELSQDFDSLWTERHCATACTRLRIVEMTLLKRLPNAKHVAFEIDVPPTQSQQFADP